MDLLLLLVLAGGFGTSSAVTCYTCSENRVYFDRVTGLFDGTNCSAPTTNFVNTSPNCKGTCVTTLSLRSSYYEIDRYCLGSTSSLCEDQCTSPTNCRLCCDSDYCNDQSVDSMIEEYRMGQTCYECRHSEIPYTGFYNPSCGLDFDSEGERIGYTFCQGLCYSGVTFIDGIEDVQRGCRDRGSSCDHLNHPYLEDKSVAFSGLDYDIKCCLGSLCNRAHPSTGATVSITFSAIAIFLAIIAL